MGRLSAKRLIRRGLILFLLSAPCVCLALETDQYYAWTRPLADSADVLNAKLNLELALAIDHLAERDNGRQTQCEAVAEQFMEQLHFTTFQDFELWALNSELIDRAPADPAEELEYRDRNLYHRTGVLDVSTWLPNVPTIEVNGIRIGTDKLAHFVSSGWRWYRAYLEGLEKGLTHEEAEQRVIDTGIFWERTLLGKMASGVFSPGDLEANYRGMEFYYELCHGPQPVLVQQDGDWKSTRKLDIATAIGPEWDESYSNPIYSKRRWRKVRPVLVGYCEERDHPLVLERRSFYRSIERETRIGSELNRLFAEGTIPEPAQFSLEMNCEEPPPAERAVTNRFQPSVSRERPQDDELIEKIRVIDSNLERRPVGAWSINFSYPDRFGGSLAILWAELPAHYDCTTLCPFEGPYLQLQLGLGAVRLGTGWARIIGEKKDNTFFVSDVYVGLGFKGSVMHTWDDPLGETPGRTFVGGEFEFTIVEINFRGGIYYRVAGPDSSDPWLLTLTVGWGF